MQKLLRIWTVLNQILLVIAQTPATLPPTNPTELTMLTGAEILPITDDAWRVPYENYKLTKVKMWKNSSNTAGFEVTFSPHPSLIGWPIETHVYGFQDETSALQEVWFDSEIQTVHICVDGVGSSSISSDFEGFKFTDSNGQQTISASCSPFYQYDIETKLIGFHVRTGVYSSATRFNIRSIALIVESSHCDASTFVFPVPLTATYNLGDPMITIRPVPPSCSTVPITYAASYNLQMTPFVFNSVDQSFDLFTSNSIDVGTYTILLTASLLSANFVSLPSDLTTQISFDVTVIDPCESNVLTFNMGSFDQTFYFGDPAQTATINQASVTQSQTGCPSLAFSFTNTDGTPMDGAVFTYTEAIDEFRIHTTDVAKIGTYDLRLNVIQVDGPRNLDCDFQCYLDRYWDLSAAFGPTNVAAAETHYWEQGFIPEGRNCCCYENAYTHQIFMDFEVIVTDPCDNIVLSLNMGPFDQTYQLRDPAQLTTMDPATVTSTTISSNCPAIVLEVTNDNGTPIDSLVFAYPEAPNQFKIETWDVMLVGTYNLRLKAYYTGYTYSVSTDFEVIVYDPCPDVALTVNMGVLDTTYFITEPVIILTIDPTSVTQNPLIATCPPIAFDIANTDGSAMDGAIFTYAPDQFEIQTNIFTKDGTYELTLKTYNDGYTNYANTDFIITVIDPCEVAILTMNMGDLDTLYIITESAITLPFDPFSVTSSATVTTCPDIVFDLLYSDNSAFDIDIFIFPAAPNELEIFTMNMTKAMDYEFNLWAHYDTYPPNPPNTYTPFNITIKTPCYLATIEIEEDVISDTNFTYSIGSATLIEQIIKDEVAVSIPGCPDIIFQLVKTEDYEEAIDDSVFTFSNETNQLEIYTTNMQKSGQYNITIIARFNDTDPDLIPVLGTFPFIVQLQQIYSGFSVNITEDEKQVFPGVVIEEITEEEAPPPRQYYVNCRIESISRTGLVTIKLSEPVITRSINVTQDELQVLYSQHATSMDLLEERLNQPTVELLTFESVLITLQLHFEKPILISQGLEQDLIEISLSKFYFLLSATQRKAESREVEAEQGMNFEEMAQLTEFLPLFVRNQAEADALSSIGSAAENAVITTIVFPFLLQFLMKGVMSKLWLWVNMMQLYNSLVILPVDMPLNVMMVQEEYNDMINMNVIPKETVNDIIEFLYFWKEAEDPQEEVQTTERRQLNETNASMSREERAMKRLKIEPKNVAQRLKGVILAECTLVLLFVIISAFASGACLRCLGEKLTFISRKLKRFLMYNSILRYTQQIFYSVCLSSMISINYGMRKEFDIMNISLSCSAILILFCFSVFTYVFMQKNKKQLPDPDFMAKYGSLYASVEYDSHKEALKYTWYFCIRRIAFASMIAFLSDYLVIQILLLTELGLLMTAWGVAETPMTNFMNDLTFIANEWVLLFSSYFILVFSMYVPTVEIRYQFGFVYLTFFGITTVFNLLILAQILWTDFKDLLKLRQLKRQSIEWAKVVSMGTKKNATNRKKQKAEREEERRNHFTKHVNQQMKRPGKNGNWHQVMTNGDIIHLSQLDQYSNLQKQDLKLKNDVYEQLGMNYEHTQLMKFPVDFDQIARKIVREMPAHRDRLIKYQREEEEAELAALDNNINAIQIEGESMNNSVSEMFGKSPKFQKKKHRTSEK